MILCLHPLTQNDRIRHESMGIGVFLGQPRHCICTNASRGLSATAEFLVYTLVFELRRAIRSIFNAYRCIAHSRSGVPNTTPTLLLPYLHRFRRVLAARIHFRSQKRLAFRRIRGCLHDTAPPSYLAAMVFVQQPTGNVIATVVRLTTFRRSTNAMCRRPRLSMNAFGHMATGRN